MPMLAYRFSGMDFKFTIMTPHKEFEKQFISRMTYNPHERDIHSHGK